MSKQVKNKRSKTQTHVSEPRSRPKLFDPDVIVTKMHQAIKRDLTPNKCEDLSELRFRQTSEFLKKFVNPDTDTSGLESLTYSKFKWTNKHMRRFTATPCCSLPLQSNSSFRDKVLLRARVLVHRVLDDFVMDEWFDHCKHGTGTSIGVPYHNTEVEAKFAFPLSTTARVIPLFESYLSYDSMLYDALTKCAGDNPNGLWYDEVRGSRATTVEKTTKIRRMIAIEPTLNMFFQQGLMKMMYERMSSHGLNVDTLPERHVRLAMVGSLCRNIGTIDFSSASDCVSAGLVQFLFPRKWSDALHKVKCDFMTIDGQEETLNMFSTMGNATTFPIETLVFWSIANAVVFTLDNPTTNSLYTNYTTDKRWLSTDRNVELYPCSVFGDDCIVPTRACVQFMQLCEGVGFIPNQEKSHYLETDPFRESCGGDFYHGFPTRPFTIKAPSSTRVSSLEPWLYTCINLLLKKYITYFGQLEYVYHLGFMEIIYELFRQYNLKIKVVPSDFPLDAGIQDTGDLHRIIRNRRVLQPIRYDQNNTPTFNYCRYMFSQTKDNEPVLRYWLRLRAFNLARESEAWVNLDSSDLFPVGPRQSKQLLELKLRRKGGYVVSRSSAPHWGAPSWLVDH